MQRNDYILTKEGKEKLEKELKELRESRPAAVEALNHARSMGDLRENSAYQATKAKLSDIDHRIVHLELMIRKSVVIEKTESDKIQIGSTVTVKNGVTSMTVTIVGETEQNPKEKKVSVKSPLAQALYGKKKGDIAHLVTPNGNISYTIEAVS